MFCSFIALLSLRFEPYHISGYNLFPLVEMKKEKTHEGYYSDCSYEDEDIDGEDDTYLHLYGFDTNDAKVSLVKIVERGHLHVLKFLKEELNHH